MLKKICFMAIFIAFVFQSVNVWSATNSLSPVYLCYRHTPKLDGTPKPSKAPVNYTLTLNVSLDEDFRQLIMQDLSRLQYTYYICDENEEVVSQGNLDFTNHDNLVIDIWPFQSGVYTLFIIYGEHTFCGNFELN